MTNSSDPMPVFVIKAKDLFATDVVRAYMALCTRSGLSEQAAEVDKALDEMTAWRLRNPDAVKLPDHPHVPVSRQP